MIFSCEPTYAKESMVSKALQTQEERRQRKQDLQDWDTLLNGPSKGRHQVQKQNQMLRMKLSQLNNNILHLKTHIQELKERESKRKESIDRLQEEADERKKINNALEEENKDLRERIRVLEQKADQENADTLSAD